MAKWKIHLAVISLLGRVAKEAGNSSRFLTETDNLRGGQSFEIAHTAREEST